MLPVVPTSRARRAGALAALVLALSVLGASPAAAHNTLRSTDPADGATVPVAPAQLTLTFDQAALELGSQVVVTGPDGAVVSDGPVQLVDVSVVQPLVEERPAGTYTVDWRVTSADGHPLTGAFTFTAADAVAPAVAAEPVAAEEPSPTAATADATAVPTPDEDEPPLDEVVLPAEPVDEGPSTGVWVAVIAGAALAVAAAVAGVVMMRRRGRGDTPPPGDAGPA